MWTIHGLSCGCFHPIFPAGICHELEMKQRNNLRISWDTDCPYVMCFIRISYCRTGLCKMFFIKQYDFNMWKNLIKFVSWSFSPVLTYGCRPVDHLNFVSCKTPLDSKVSYLCWDASASETNMMLLVASVIRRGKKEHPSPYEYIRWCRNKPDTTMCNPQNHLYLGVSENAGTQQPWVFLLKTIILGCFGGTTI